MCSNILTPLLYRKTDQIKLLHRNHILVRMNRLVFLESMILYSCRLRSKRRDHSKLVTQIYDCKLKWRRTLEFPFLVQQKFFTIWFFLCLIMGYFRPSILVGGKSWHKLLCVKKSISKLSTDETSKLSHFMSN